MPITALKGVGPRLARALKQLKVSTIQDLLFHLPSRYEDRTRITTIAELSLNTKALIEGRVVQGHVQCGKRRSLLCRFSDGTGEIQLRFFHFNARQLEHLTSVDLQLRCFGEVRAGYRGGMEMVHPEYRDVAHVEQLPVADRLTPIYAATQGLAQNTLRKLIEQALHLLRQPASVTELLSTTLLNSFADLGLREALLYLHHPPVDADVNVLLQGRHMAQQRLAYEELIAHQLGLVQFRQQCRARMAKILKPASLQLQGRLLASLSFTLTRAQQKVIAEINADIAKPHPMMRLVQGDVGSGKTIVAACALLQAVENHSQAALMAPTELLAEQHYQTLQRWFSALDIRVGFLSGSQTEKTRREILAALSNHQIDVVIGTHALFQEKVQFADLSLLVIDEQHRFGVHQRLALKEKATRGEQVPHQLIMTVTPIPRTLAMTAYADLDVSLIDELPPGRQPIQSILIPNERRQEIIERVKMNCRKRRQAYWVCTIIEDSEILRAKAASVLWENLSTQLTGLSVGLVHGRLVLKKKEQTMAKFKAGEIDLLVATTVIEVGVDVPNATLMIIENAERLGLAQLHQLRGRIGRGHAASFCVFLFQKPLSPVAYRRLQVMRQSQDGFYIAEQDLQIRGPGEVLGARQTGLIRLKIADLLRDQHLLAQVKEASHFIVMRQPDVIQPLLERWLKGAEHY